MPTTDSPAPGNALELTQALVRRASVTPEDAGCQQLLAERLAALGFEVERLDFGKVTNLWARSGTSKPLFVFAGHTDVVPAGDHDAWRSPPFEPCIRGGTLYGRGAADMKSGLAAMIVASERFLAGHPHPRGSIAFLVTSDEEGDAVDGTARVVEHLRQRGDQIDYCVVGEPSSNRTLGDVVRVGRRGSLNAVARVRGVQGHVAYPDAARNPIHLAAPVLAELVTRRWDSGNEFFPPTGFQISNIQAGTGATNVIPGELRITFNFRLNTEQRPESLREIVEEIFARHGVDAAIDWTLSGMPFLTVRGRLIDAVESAIGEVTGHGTALSTGGGTSDGRFIAPTGAEVVELGVINETIHKVDECVAIEDIDRLARIYEAVLVRLLG